WLGLDAFAIDPDNLQVRPHESDSYYRYKYPHRTYAQIRPPKPHSVPLRIQQQIEQQFSWYYQTFYPSWVKN
ncbi:MAG: hypothetical protein RL637_410, partial [Pseudomonadota bacterium]